MELPRSIFYSPTGPILPLGKGLGNYDPLMESISPGLAIVGARNHLHIWSYKDVAERDRRAQEYAAGSFATTVETCDVRTLDWVNPNRQNINTGCKAFDKQTTSVMTGNVMANTMLSWYIRPRNETKCNGFDFKPGELQESDLKVFAQLKSDAVIRCINHLPRAESEMLILTVVFHGRRGTDGRKERVIHGGLITDTLLRQVRRFDRNEFGLSWRTASCKIMDAVIPHLTDQKAINRVPCTLQ